MEWKDFWGLKFENDGSIFYDGTNPNLALLRKPIRKVEVRKSITFETKYNDFREFWMRLEEA